MTVADKPPVNINRSERVLAYMILSTIAVSIIAIFAALIGVGTGADGSTGIWPVIVILPSIGLPIAFALIIALVITSAVRRGRAARDGSQ
jgi:hypothetical protein